MPGILATRPRHSATRPFVRSAVLILLLMALCSLAFAPAAFAATDNSSCKLCHAMTVPPVDRNTACKSCHLSFAGTHPYHQAGANCGAACHSGWGASSATALPVVTDFASGAAFATDVSKDMPASVLHVIHSVPSWPAALSGGSLASACSSCHAVAACNACHSAPIAPEHAAHSASGSAKFTAVDPWVGTMGRGVLLNDQTMRTATTGPNQCASAECHDVTETQAGQPGLTEDYNYAAGGNPTQPEATNSAITAVGAWRSRYSASYSAGRMSYTNSVVASLTATVSGDRVEIISERDPYRGQARVLLDGVVVGTFDGYAPFTTRQAVVFSIDLPAGTHTVGVAPTGTMNSAARAAFVVVDAFKVYPLGRDSTVPACVSCHNPMLTHGAVHETSSTCQAPVEFPGRFGTGGGTVVIRCLSCHRDNLLSNHGTDYTNCVMCHQPGGPRSSFTTWDTSCQTGDCHPGATAPHPPTHTAHYHNRMAPGEQPEGMCQSCHNGPVFMQCGSPFGCHTGAVPPATSVDYTSPVTVVSRFAEEPITWKLLATDVGDGVAATYYSFDGAPFALYTQVDAANGIVNPADSHPPFLHTLRYYSVDAAGNAEAIQTENYDVNDTTPPVITFNGLNGGTVTKSLTMSVTDPKVNGLNSGVASIQMETVVFYRWWNNWVGNGGVMPWYKTLGCSASYPLDGSWDSTRVVTNIEASAGVWHVPPNQIERYVYPSGDAFTFYLKYSATDYAGNQSTPIETTISIDNAPPVTTAASAGTYRWKLNATDTAAAGVHTTHYSFDSAPFVLYTAADHTAGIVNTQPGGADPGAHVLQYYSVDKLGNTELIKTLNYTIP